LIDLLGRLDGPTVRETAETVFAERATHPLPPTVAIPVEWRLELEGLAKELGYSVTSSAEIEARFRAFVARLEGESERER
jgi:hypothetical protein